MTEGLQVNLLMCSQFFSYKCIRAANHTSNMSSTVSYCVSGVYCLVNLKIFLSEYKLDLQTGSH